MSGIVIHGMELPDPDHICLVEVDSNGDVFAAYDGGRTKLEQYKAVPVPAHGCVIDADAFVKRMNALLPRTECYRCPVRESAVFCSTFRSCGDAWLAWIKYGAGDANDVPAVIPAKLESQVESSTGCQNRQPQHRTGGKNE